MNSYNAHLFLNKKIIMRMEVTIDIFYNPLTLFLSYISFYSNKYHRTCDLKDSGKLTLSPISKYD